MLDPHNVFPIVQGHIAPEILRLAWRPMQWSDADSTAALESKENYTTIWTSFSEVASFSDGGA